MDKQPFDWNPDYLWRILRYSEQYQSAVDEFIAAVVQDQNATVLQKFLTYSQNLNETDEVYYGRPTGAKVIGQTSDGKPIRVPVLSKAQNRKDDLSKRKPEVSDTTAFENPYYDLLDTSYGRKFLAWYGDILSFPIDYRIIRPFILQKVWTLRPVNHVKSGIYNRLGKTTNAMGGPPTLLRLQPMAFLVNLNFSETTIAKEIASTVREWVQERGTHYKDMGNFSDLIGKAPKVNTIENNIMFFERKPITNPPHPALFDRKNNDASIKRSLDLYLNALETSRSVQKKETVAAKARSLGLIDPDANLGPDQQSALNSQVTKSDTWLKSILKFFNREPPHEKFWK